MATGQSINFPLPDGARLVPDFPDYCVTAEGALYGRRYHPKRNKDCHWRPFKAGPVGVGYVDVNLHNEAGIWHTRLHIVVMLTFVGLCPDGQEVRHLDGIKTNCRLTNLFYGTPLENGADTRRLRLAVHGEKHHKAQLTDYLVRQIRSLRAEGHTYGEIASRLNITPAQVGKVVRRESWNHVT